MRDYPSIPNVFRVSGGSTNSVNLIDRERDPNGRTSGGIQSLISPGRGGDTTLTSGGGAGSSSTTAAGGRCPAKKTEKDLSSVGIELNYHNGKSSEYLLRRSATTGSNSNRHVSIAAASPGHPTPNNNSNNFNFVGNNSQLRLGGGSDGSAAINSISGAIPPPIVANVGNIVGAGGMFSEESDLNLSLNSFTDINNMPSCSAATATTTTIAAAAAATRHRDKTATYLEDHRVTLNRRFSSERNSGYFLWIMTPVAASFSVAIVIAALAGPQWLFTEEKLPNANYNGTANFNAQDDGAFITKYTKSSLWILCTAQQETYNCIKIDYFPKEGYQPDPHDSTPAIPYTITKSCPFFLASGVFLLISFIVFLVPTCSHQNNLYYFSSGIMFIVSGLFMLIGLIAYISILKAEIGSKLRPRSTLQPALFKVTYGQSFFLYVFGFISTEFVGVLNVFLYISLQEVGYYSKLPCLSLTSVQEKIREGENRNSKHHPHRRRKENLAVTGYNCKKHPSNVFNDLEKRYYFEKPQKCDLHSKNIAKSLNELYTEPAPQHFHHLPPQDIHYQQQQQQQQHHQRHQQQQQQLHHHQQQQQQYHHQQPSELFAPLTRSVSTATEIFSNAANGNAGQQTNNHHFQNNNATEKRASTSSNTSTTKKHQATLTCKPRDDRHHRDDDNESIGSGDDANDDGDDGNGEASCGTRMRNGSSTTSAGIQDICGLSRGIRKTKDEFFNEFCKKAGVRPKPKDIYFINDDHEDDPHHDDENIYIVDCAKPQNSSQQQQQQLHHHQQQQRHQTAAFYYPNLRRNSMFVDMPPSNSLRKQNSNLSLHADTKIYQKSLFDLDRCESEIWNTYPEHYYAKGSAAAVANAKQLQDCNVYQSRTLPRSFMKRNFDSQESLGMMATTAMASAGSHGRLSVSGQGHNHYPSAAQATRLSNVSRDANVYRSSGQMLHKSCEDVRNVISSGGGGGGSRRTSTNLMPSAVQWPTAIPTSPSNFSSNSYLYGNQPQHQSQHQHQHQQHPAMLGRTASTKFAHASYGYDDRRADVSAGGVYDAFDLDEIERERRRSHASLFDGRYDVINGTAV